MLMLLRSGQKTTTEEMSKLIDSVKPDRLRERMLKVQSARDIGQTGR